jgi:hypothetical protein
VNYCHILDCQFYAQAATAGSNTAIRLDTADQSVIDGCTFMGDFAVAAINGVGAASTLSRISHNYIYNDDTGAAENIIDIDVASTGLLAYNACGSLKAATVLDCIDPGSMLSVENYACNAVDEYGIAVPTAASA